MRVAMKMPASRREPAGRLFEGLATGEARTHRKLSMLALMGADRPGPAYLLLNDAMAAGLVTVGEVSEGGSVPELLLDNRAERPVLAVDGQELVGARQNRVLNLSLLLAAVSKTVVPVSCVEQGRWHYESREFSPSRHMMFASAKLSKAHHVTRSMRRDGSRHSDQGDVWERVASKFEALGKDSPTMAMDEVFEDFDGDLGAFAKALSPVAGQRGAVYLVDGVLAGVELFDRAATFAALHESLTRSYAMDAIEAERRKPTHRDVADAAQFLSMLSTTEAEVWPAVGLGEDWRSSDAAVVLAALVVDGVAVHASASPAQPDGEEGRWPEMDE
jgi:hypothetical protein